MEADFRLMMRSILPERSLALLLLPGYDTVTEAEASPFGGNIRCGDDGDTIGLVFEQFDDDARRRCWADAIASRRRYDRS